MSEFKELQHVRRIERATPEADKVTSNLADLRGLLTRLEQLVVPEVLPQTAGLNERIDNFSVKISLIGQVKAGKTALANAVLGEHELLPSDVNPWTSVVTSVHLNRPGPKNKRAIFRFFNRTDWDSMIETGGRVAQLAKKANLDTEFEDLRSQIKEMQRRTTARLGRNFEMLLGSQHAFSEFDNQLIKRYVCLGEEGEDQSREGRFADMTKSADLYLDNNHFTYPVTFCDTPGVNDPFLVREAVTLDNLGKSDICVIVLSAHQALSTADLALMRILVNLKREQIVLFINRIDELAEPQRQIEEIKSHIHETLQNQNLDSNVPIVFGSAAWAEAHVAQTIEVLPEDSITTLNNLIEVRANGDIQGPGNLSGLDDVTGLSALQEVLDRKAIDDICVPFTRAIAQNALDYARQSRALLAKTADRKPQLATKPSLNIAETERRIENFIGDVGAKFDEVRDAATEKMLFDMSGAFNNFIFQGSRELVTYMEGSGRMSDWTPDAEALRRSLNQIYSEMTQDMLSKIAKLYRKTYEVFDHLYSELGMGDARQLGLTSPTLASPDTPISLMRTMTVDVSGGWVSGWLIRKLKKDVYVRKFKDVTLEQMKITVAEVRQKHIDDYCDAAQTNLLEFIDLHMGNLRQHAKLESAEERAALRRKLGNSDVIETRINELEDHIAEFQDIIDTIEKTKEQRLKIA